jgi:hypothetical protein
MSENGMAADCVPARAGTAMAKAIAASSVSSVGPIRRQKRADMELRPDVLSLFVFMMDSFLMLDACPSGR